jgi:hypothetical protein
MKPARLPYLMPTDGKHYMRIGWAAAIALALLLLAG